ncbi:Pepco domain-containing protein [Vacuolonema iberomarrocanum]|uniref:Pepco domain-containing protein n=1 Tax=Vacuolonema iberomarrocanum TaxID=3454632 RepID=UPI0019E502B7|nr:hypothetical protein [filamentous cyanobacterium LEGE 07170]
MSEEPVWIMTYEDEEAIEGGKGWGDDLAKRAALLKPQPIDPKKLTQEWKRTMRVVRQLIQQAGEEVGENSDMQLDEVTLAVEITTKGQVSILGACSGEASGKGAITLKFKRA